MGHEPRLGVTISDIDRGKKHQVFERSFDCKQITSQHAEYINTDPEIIKHILKDDGQFPNSGLYLLIYKNAFILPEKGAAAIIKKAFRKNNWGNAWKNGIFDYHHYHSIAHEGACCI